MGETAAHGGAFTVRLGARVEEITFEALPAGAARGATLGILDATGVALAGWQEESARAAFHHARAQYTRGGSSVLGSDVRLAPTGAAFANGTLAHALDFDDTAWSYVGHPSAVVYPAALALAEPRHASGRELITAYVAGFEAASLVGRGIVDVSETRGWHLTSAVGVVGAAAAAGRLLDLSGPALTQAFGLGASAAGGLKANFGWMAKPLHAGMAARSGVEAALLAGAGVTASPNVFDHPLGFFTAFAERGPGPDPGGPLAIVADGIAFKRYPSCTGSHPAVQGALELRNEHGIKPEDVAHIRCGVTSEVRAELLYPMPATPSQARFSMSFPVAVALTEGHLDLGDFSTEMLARPLIRELMGRCEMLVDPGLARPADVHAPAGTIEIRLTDGTVVSSRVDSARGNPADPLSEEELAEKFRACAASRLRDPRRVESLCEALLDLENIPDVAEITTMTEPR